jgi:hypothetical protein
MDQLFTEQVLRMFERHMVVIGGIIAIVLGYRLFQSADLKQDSTGSMKTKLFEVSATKIGPGVFFAAFGTVVLWTSLTRWFNPYEIRTDCRMVVSQEELTQLQDLAGREQRTEDRELLRLMIDRIKRSAEK